MGELTFNNKKGRVAHYATLPAADDSLIAVLLKATGLEADAAMADHDTLAALLAAANDEADFTNYTRQTLTGVVVTVDDAGEKVDIDCDDIIIASAGGATNNTLGKIVICYKPTAAAADAAIEPLCAHDVSITTDGNELQLRPPVGGFWRAT